VAVPSRDAFTFAMTSASALNDARTSRIDFICVAERPEADFAGATGAAGVAGVTAGVAGVVGVMGAAEVAGVAEPLPPVLVLVEQSVLDGVMVTVTGVPGVYLRSD